MERNYDVVVIGAGNGGLSASAVCAKNGLKTLLVEQHNLPGDLRQAFEEGGLNSNRPFMSCAGWARRRSREMCGNCSTL